MEGARQALAVGDAALAAQALMANPRTCGHAVSRATRSGWPWSKRASPSSPLTTS